MGMEEMDDDLFYDSYQLVSDLPDRDLLEQRLEEASQMGRTNPGGERKEGGRKWSCETMSTMPIRHQGR